MRIGLIGFGVVGQGVGELLRTRGAAYASRAGEPLELVSVLVRNTGKERDHELPAGAELTDDPDAFFGSTPDVVIEAMGGAHAPLEYLTRAIESGADVVTANKSLVAAHGNGLYALAERCRTRIHIEAALAGGLPVHAALVHGLGANTVHEFAGILNATCNEVLTAMSERNEGFHEALARAQRNGFAEPDPTMDVNGHDAAEKLAILATLMYQQPVSAEGIRVSGIERITTEDQRLARELGYTIRLIARAHGTPRGVYLRVAPMLVDRAEPLAGVFGPRLACTFVADPVGRTMLIGEGAGRFPTASAILSDVIALAVTRPDRSGGKRLNHWPVGASPLEIAPAGETAKRFFVRLPMRHHDGSVRELLAHLARFGVGVQTLHELPETLVLITEPTGRSNLDACLDTPCSSGFDIAGRVTLRVYTPEWEL